MKRGFSLVELSIVLVILGLLTGGILAGQSLIRASELRSVTNDVSRYKTAINTFRDKYFQMPGDMNNAVKFWGAQAGAATDGRDATCAALTTAATGPVTCNGDGSGIIGNGGAAGYEYEFYRAWQHLANAGMIEGSYSGVAGAGSAFEAVPGTNTPRLRISNAGIGFTNSGSDNWGLQVQNTLLLGSYSSASYLYTGFLKAEELWNIDTKLDDGRPSSGSVRTYNASFNGNCVTTDVASTAAYNLSNAVLACIFYTNGA